MRVSVLGLRGLPGVMGGVEAHCEQLYPRIVRQSPGLSVKILGRRPYIPAAASHFEGLEVLGLPCLSSRSLEAISSAILGVLYAKVRARADLLHIHAIGPGLVSPFARLLGLKTVVTHHGRDYERAKWGVIARATLRLGEWLAIQGAHRVIAVSPSLVQQLRTTFPRQAHKISFIANGAMRPRGDQMGPGQAAALYEALRLPERGFILAVGRLVPEKGFDDLITASESLGCALPIVIAGGVEHEDSYARRLRERSSQRVKFIGFQPHAVLRQLYEKTALFVMPSHHEGLPIAALEAMACGAPMLLSDIAANKDLGLPDHCYFPVGDIDALVLALRKNFREYGHYDRRLLEAFDWDRVAQATLSLYQGLTATPLLAQAQPQQTV